MYKDDWLAHEGKAHDENPPGRGSGRYAWMSGANPGQHQERNLYVEVMKLKEQIKQETGGKLTTAEIDRMCANAFFGETVPLNEYKIKLRIARNDYRKAKYEDCMKCIEKHMDPETGKYNRSEVAKEMGFVSESSYRVFLQSMENEKSSRDEKTAEVLRDYISKGLDSDSKGMINVSSNAHLALGVTSSTLDTAVKILKEEGYSVQTVKVQQMGTGKYTTMKVVCPPGTDKKDVYKNILNVKILSDDTVSDDQGKTYKTLQHPTSLDSSRVAVRYKEDGGTDRDGLIELRRGVADLSLQNANYAQVRIAVDGTHYLKGMAVYSDDLPPGIDVRFNTNKSKDVPMMGEDNDHSVLKKLKTFEADNPSAVFGATIKPNGQYEYEDKDGKKKLSPLNIISREGDWEKWSHTLPSQFTVKQGSDNINMLTSATILSKTRELDDIKSLTNPVIKQKMLDDYAAKCETMATDLETHGLKGQAYHVLLPVPSLKPGEIYAPNYKNGEKVAVIRYPHQGIWEIVVATVNNNNQEAKRMMSSQPRDAIGITPRQGTQLSGADYDGDTGTVIPLGRNPNFRLKSMDPIKELLDWDFNSIYKLPEGAKGVSDHTKQTQMGVNTNLLCDMAASYNNNKDSADMPSDLLKDMIRVNKQTLVVIDCVKHRLDYKKCAEDQGIADLKAKYQSYVDENGRRHNGGASTIVTRAGKKQNEIEELTEITNRNISKARQERLGLSDNDVEDIKKRWDAGESIYIPTHRTKQERKPVELKKGERPEDVFNERELAIYKAGKKVYRYTGKEVPVTMNMKPMLYTQDARDLVKDKSNPVEMAYATYANELKNLARDARSTSRTIEFSSIDPSAKQVYKKEVDELKAQVNEAKRNSSKELAAQIMAKRIYEDFKRDNPDSDKDKLKKERNKALSYARDACGAHKKKVVITDRQWEAIQSHAVSTALIKDIINNTDTDKFKERAMPREQRGLTDAQKSSVKALAAMLDGSGNRRYTTAELAEEFGVSTSTISRAINGES